MRLRKSIQRGTRGAMDHMLFKDWPFPPPQTRVPNFDRKYDI